jgi:tetratricopeptide (TPR) repeat protein
MRNVRLRLTLFASIVSLAFLSESTWSQQIPRRGQVPMQLNPNAPSIPKSRPKPIAPVAKAYLDLGKAFFNEGNWNAAIENLKKALEREPGLGEAHLFLAKARYEKKSYKDAEESIKRALNDPSLDKADIHNTLGNIYLGQTEYKKAEAEFAVALKLDPGEPAYPNNLAYAYALQSKNLKEALELANQALKSTPDVDYFSRANYLDTRAWIYHQMGKYSEAEADSLDALRNTEKIPPPPYLPLVYYHLGEVYLRQNKTELAKQEFQKALKIDNTHREALDGLRKIP